MAFVLVRDIVDKRREALQSRDLEQGVAGSNPAGSNGVEPPRGSGRWSPE